MQDLVQLAGLVAMAVGQATRTGPAPQEGVEVLRKLQQGRGPQEACSTAKQTRPLCAAVVWRTRVLAFVGCSGRRHLLLLLLPLLHLSEIAVERLPQACWYP